MEWLIAHAAEIVAITLIADRVAAATPETFKLFGIPVGKWDNQLVDLLKFVTGAVFKKPK